MSMVDGGGYCPDCGACGEDGCCPPWKCKHTENCMYPRYENTLHIKFRRLVSPLERKIQKFLWKYFKLYYSYGSKIRRKSKWQIDD